ncbi:MAG: substrate-binding domain-containing protein [Lachnospiraceae bacterium]|jgi:phosphate transport system substrate-binding protein|nr:substrate-binding domain-containing protein [Lachnospiraceae bacterium]
MKTKKILSILLSLSLIIALMTSCSLFNKSNENNSEDEALSDDETSTIVNDNDDDQSIPEGIPGLSASNCPVIDGSTACMPLIAAIYAKACGITRTEAENRVTVNQTENSWDFLLQSVTGAADDWQGGDLLLVYLPSLEMQSRIKAVKELDITPIGRDALVFLTGEDNKVESLTMQQIRDIYTGKTTDWKDLGGDEGEIKAIQRNEGSGSQALFLDLVMKDEKPMTPSSQYVISEMGMLIDELEKFDKDNMSIGFSVFYYADNMYHSDKLKYIAVDGIIPSKETIAANTYPLTHEFYLVMRSSEPSDSPSRILRDWLLSENGEQLIDDEGYVAIPDAASLTSNKLP